jgi:hypothetical protein
LGGVSDVVKVKEQKSAALAGLERLHRSIEAVGAQTVEIHTLFVVNTHGTVRRNLAVREVKGGDERCGGEFRGHYCSFTKVFKLSPRGSDLLLQRMFWEGPQALPELTLVLQPG